ERKGKLTKVPFQVNGILASSTDPRTWTTFSGAIKALKLSRGGDDAYDGIGYVFSADDGLIGIDLDDCVDPETRKIAAWAKEIIELVGPTYAEVSPSGTGVKLWVRGELPSDREQKTGARRGYQNGAVEI